MKIVEFASFQNILPKNFLQKQKNLPNFRTSQLLQIIQLYLQTIFKPWKTKLLKSKHKKH